MGCFGLGDALWVWTLRRTTSGGLTCPKSGLFVVTQQLGAKNAKNAKYAKSQEVYHKGRGTKGGAAVVPPWGGSIESAAPVLKTGAGVPDHHHQSSCNEKICCKILMQKISALS